MQFHVLQSAEWEWQGGPTDGTWSPYNFRSSRWWTMELKDLVFYLLSFLVLLWFLCYILILLFWDGNIYLLYIIEYWKYVTYYLIEVKKRDWVSEENLYFNWISVLELLKTTGISEVGVNTFCILRRALVYADEWKTWFESDICLAVVSTAVTKHQEQSDLFLPITLRSHSSRAGTWEAGAGAESLEGYFAVWLLKACLACFLSQPKTTF